MNRELRERVVLPVLIPVLAILVTETCVFGLSRVLLATGRYQAVGIALGTALSILFGSALLAARPRLGTSTLAGAVAVVLVAAVAGGVWGTARGPAYKRGGAEAVPTVKESARNLAFTEKTLKLSARGTVIAFSNEDTQPHNIAIFPSASALDQPLFRGTIVTPGQTADYRVGRLKPGTYYFHCDVHPAQMSGSVVVE